MIFQDFIHTVKDCVDQKFNAGYHVSLQQVLKNNGVCYESLLIARQGSNLSPMVYLNPYYHRYLNGMSIQDICEDICSVYHKKLPSFELDMSFFFNYEEVKGGLVPKLINYEKNRQMLESVPNVRFLDLAVVFLYVLPQDKCPTVMPCSDVTASDGSCHVQLDDNADDAKTLDDAVPAHQGFASLLIRNEHMKLWQITAEQLYHDAMHNAPLLLPSEIKTMPDILDEFSDLCFNADNKDLCPNSGDLDLSDYMYVLSNTRRINGATVVLYEGLLAEAAKLLNSNLIVLPSSIHEMIVVPAEDIPREDLDDFNQMVQEVNATQVADDEILANHAYYYDAALDMLSIL